MRIKQSWFVVAILAWGVGLSAYAQEWRSEPQSAMDRDVIAQYQESIDTLARRHFGSGLNGNKDHDLALLQRLLDEGIVGKDQVALLQGMGLVLGELLKQQKGLLWVAYYDKLGRSRALQVPGFDKDFIYPATQISRLAEVGIKVNVGDVYHELEQAVDDIRNKPPF